MLLSRITRRVLATDFIQFRLGALDVSEKMKENQFTTKSSRETVNLCLRESSLLIKLKDFSQQ